MLVVALLPACRSDEPASTDLAGSTPVPGRHLDRATPGNAGLLSSVGLDGLPVREGDTADPLVIESRRFYDTLGSPGAMAESLDYPDPFTGAPGLPRTTAPMSFENWKTAFGFPAQEPGETMDAYRKRLGVVVYYNRNELGLGRELGCAEFVDGADVNGAPLIGLACFVTNYGPTFRDQAHGLALAIEGTTPRNTVCITYRPSMDPGYQVQFYTYGSEGRRQEWAQLDSMGPRPHPHVCINCHGGSYDVNRHLARNARFLPLDPNLVVFSADPATGRDRATQEEWIRHINAASVRTPLTEAQREMLRELYPGGVETPGVPSAPDWVAPGWKDSPRDMETFSRVVKPYCSTCHLAIEQGAGGVEAFSHRLLRTAGAFRSFPMPAVVCGTFTMPNSQPTMLALWDAGGTPITVVDRSFPSAADALLGYFDRSRNDCGELASLATCNRGSDPDALCGNASSGMACNRVSGRCVPEFGNAAAGTVVRGHCRLDGSRTCPATLECRPAPVPTPGLETFDGHCVAP